MAERQYLRTDRLQTAYHRMGTPGKPKLLLVHGNASSSAFYLPLMERLADRFDMVAPDLRCFGGSDALPVDAARGMRDWSDDLYEFTAALGWDRFWLLGWSLGGGIVMQYAIDHSEQLCGLILEAPLSPFGFGGTCTPEGKKLTPVGLASGGGCANAQLVEALKKGDLDFMRTVLNSTYVKPPYQVPERWEPVFLEAIASTKVGDGMYPGDSFPVPQWPGVVSGTHGICNTMSPAYCDLSGLADIPNQCPILWIRGDGDIMVSDNSLADFGTLGALGYVPGWPGAEYFPSQPMLAQTRYVLDRYAANGGSYREVVLPDSGHGCHLDQEEAFAAALTEFMSMRRLHET